jgi:hypothetical protein
MLMVLTVIVVLIVVIIVVSLCIGLTFKQFIEVAVATASIGAAIIVLIGFYYKSKEKKISNSMDRVTTMLDIMGSSDELACLWSEIEGTATAKCPISLRGRVQLVKVLKEMDAALYSERVDPSIDFIIARLFKSETIRTEYYKNRILFSLKFNNYIQTMLS